MSRTSITAWLLVMVGGVGAQELSVTLSPRQDNTLYQSALGDLSNGSGTHLFVGITNQGRVRRALVAFNLSALPPGAVVTGATLTVHVTRAPSLGAPPLPVTVHRLARDWGESTSVAPFNGGQGGTAATGDATWIHNFYNDMFWDTVGGDFVATASAGGELPSSGESNLTGDGLVDDLEFWLERPERNFGWILIENFAGSGNARQIGSREGTVSLAPSLTVFYVDDVLFRTGFEAASSSR